jgi:predicted nucleic acid-binding protein
MTLYLDSSNIVKLYVQELDTERVKRSVVEAANLATSRIAYVEVRCALSRKRREGQVSPGDYAKAVSAFRADWGRFVAVEITQPVVELAAELCGAHVLRSMDAIHLASAKLLAGSQSAPVRVSSSDLRLDSAAKAEGLA